MPSERLYSYSAALAAGSMALSAIAQIVPAEQPAPALALSPPSLAVSAPAPAAVAASASSGLLFTPVPLSGLPPLDPAYLAQILGAHVNVAFVFVPANAVANRTPLSCLVVRETPYSFTMSGPQTVEFDPVPIPRKPRSVVAGAAAPAAPAQPAAVPVAPAAIKPLGYSPAGAGPPKMPPNDFFRGGYSRSEAVVISGKSASVHVVQCGESEDPPPQPPPPRYRPPPVNTVPEPGSLVLVGSALAALAYARRRSSAAKPSADLQGPVTSPNA